MTPENTIDRANIDVSHLPSVAFDHRSPLWWGNLLGLLIETAMFGILIAVYATVAMNLSPFPPPRVDRLPVIRDPVPDLTLPIVGLVLLLLSLIPAIFLDLKARRRDTFGVKVGVTVTLAFNIAIFIVRYYEFDSLHFKWDENAYGSITWMILGMHLLHIIVLGCEDILVVLWVFAKGLDDKHAVDITVTAAYWYWIVAMWIVLFPVVYLVPRFI